jgi:hypothetical protein
MALYKYMMKEHLRAFMARGSLKIGTLYEYRETENYGPVIGDAQEGNQTTAFEIPSGGTVNLMDDSPEAVFLREYFPGINGARRDMHIEFEEGCEFHFNNASPNLFIYCTTSRFDADVMKEFGYDACLEIVNTGKFLQEVTRKIRHHGSFNEQLRIVYAERTTTWKKPHLEHPATMKALEYSYQNEVRAIWTPIKVGCEPLFVDVPRAVKYCRPYLP